MVTTGKMPVTVKNQESLIVTESIAGSPVIELNERSEKNALLSQRKYWRT